MHSGGYTCVGVSILFPLWKTPTDGYGVNISGTRFGTKILIFSLITKWVQNKHYGVKLGQIGAKFQCVSLSFSKKYRI